MKPVAVQHYRTIKGFPYIRSISGLQPHKSRFEAGASAFAKNHKISVHPYETTVNSLLRNLFRLRAVRRGLRAVGVGGQTYIVEMAAGLVMEDAAHLTWITNVANQIEAKEGALR